MIDFFDLKPDGFVYNGQKRLMYGTVNGILVMIEPYVADSKHQISLQIDAEHSPDKERFLEELHALEDTYPFVSYAGYLNGMTVVINVNAAGEDDRHNLERVIGDITAKCAEYQLHSCCESCGTTNSLSYVEVNGSKKLLCGSCISRLSGTIPGEDAKGRERFILGVIGALAGAIFGSLLWILLDQVGFIAGIAGYAIVFCSVRGYEMLGRKVSKKGIVVCVILSVLAVAGADFVSLGITIYREFSADYYITFLDAITSVPYFLSYPDILADLVKNLVIGYGFAIWGSYSFVVKLWRMVKEQDRPVQITWL